MIYLESICKVPGFVLEIFGKFVGNFGRHLCNTSRIHGMTQVMGDVVKLLVVSEVVVLGSDVSFLVYLFVFFTSLSTLCRSYHDG